MIGSDGVMLGLGALLCVGGIAACSSCDDYRLVPGHDGMLVRCDDCRCRVHGCALDSAAKCPECLGEAFLAEDFILSANPVLHPLRAAIA